MRDFVHSPLPVVFGSVLFEGEGTSPKSLAKMLGKGREAKWPKM